MTNNLDLQYIYFSDQPLVIIYQNARQRERMSQLGTGVVFMDASYKGNQ